MSLENLLPSFHIVLASKRHPKQFTGQTDALLGVPKSLKFSRVPRVSKMVFRRLLSFLRCTSAPHRGRHLTAHPCPGLTRQLAEPGATRPMHRGL